MTFILTGDKNGICPFCKREKRLLCFQFDFTITKELCEDCLYFKIGGKFEK